MISYSEDKKGHRCDIADIKLGRPLLLFFFLWQPPTFLTIHVKGTHCCGWERSSILTLNNVFVASDQILRLCKSFWVCLELTKTCNSNRERI